VLRYPSSNRILFVAAWDPLGEPVAEFVFHTRFTT
jgi:hypothetical protein